MSGELTVRNPVVALPAAAAKPSWGRSAGAGYLIMFLFFGVFGGWAAIAPLGSGVIAVGELRVVSEVKKVQHFSGGIVQEILVREGDMVTEGQALIRLDPVRADAELQMLRNQLLAQRTQRVRLIAERDGLRGLVFPEDIRKAAEGDPELARMLKNQADLFKTRRDSIEGQVVILRERIRQTRTEIEALRRRNVANQRQLELVREELAGVRVLAEKGLVVRPRLLALERTEAAIDGEIGTTAANIARSEQRIGELELQIVDLRQRFLNDAVQELRAVEVAVTDLGERLRVAADNSRRLDIVAPRSGRVQDMQVHTVGGVIQGGQVLMQIVPNDEELVVVAEVKPRDIDNVVEGATVQVRLTSFSQRYQHPIAGTLVSVSLDKTTKAGYSPLQGFYRALIRLDPESAKHILGDAQIYSGMPATALIAVGERTLLEYWLFPIIKSFELALREP